MLKNQPCRVTYYSECKTGKHGACKCTFRGKDIFTGKDYSYHYTSSDTVQKPIVTKTEYTCSEVQDDDYLFLITEEGELREDVSLPQDEHLQDVVKRIRQICEDGKKECLVTLQKWGDKEQIVAVREGMDM